jgi:pimeloyl-ACP methyl ester carboxylesterase
MWPRIFGVSGVILTLFLGSTAFAQAKKAEEEAVKIPKPEDIVIETDNVDLHCTYYPSPRGKEAVPVLLVHGWGSRRTEVAALAQYLQEQGQHAVLVPDLRGHGDSTVLKPAPGVPAKDIKPEDLAAVDITKMATTDYIFIKNELIKRNNAGEFNIQLLTVVGLEFGSNLALHWAAVDWSQPEVTFTYGRDVKALVLISPQAKHKQLVTSPPKGPLAHPAVKALISMMTIGGANDTKMKAEMKTIDNAIKRFHPEPVQRQNESDEDFEKRYYRDMSYFMREKATTLQGMKLVEAPNLKVGTDILGFIKLRLLDRVAEKDLPVWEGDRRKENLPR